MTIMHNGTKKEYSLIELKLAAKKICEMAFEKRKEIGGAVNYNDLRCCETQRYITDLGDVGYRVIIEESSPDATELHRFINHNLREMGFKGVEISLEW
jgi:hypothetical protein